MTQDFVEDLVAACEAEGIPFFIVVGTDRTACHGFKTFFDLSTVDLSGYASIEQLMFDVIRNVQPDCYGNSADPPADGGRS